MAFAAATHNFGTFHSISGIGGINNAAFGNGFKKTGPAATCVELGGRVEQLRSATDAVVAAVGPDRLVLAGKGAFCGGVPRHFKRATLGILGGQYGLPLGIGLLDLGCHGGLLQVRQEEQ